MEKKYNFQKFQSINSRTNGANWSITRSFAVGLSSEFCETYKLSSYRFAVLYFDKNTKSIGINFTYNNKPASFTITRNGAGPSASISARSFFKKNQIPVEKYSGKKFIPKKLSLKDALGTEEEGDLFVIDLEEDLDDKPKGL